MNRRALTIPFLTLLSLSLLPGGSAARAAGQGPEGGHIREPILAGTWYPAHPDALKKVITDLLSRARPEAPEGQIKAIIVPHAGYAYSGRVAAYAYRLVKDMPLRRVVLIGPSHHLPFRGISVSMESAYKTPLGIVPVDQSFAGTLLKRGSPIRWVPQAHAREHSLEIQIPFLQTVLRDFQIVPIVMGEQNLEICSSLAESLLQAMGNSEGSLLVASTDLSHFHSYEQAKALDGRFMKLLKDLDPDGLARSIDSGSCEACGAGPALAVMLAARKLGANNALMLHYANSGDVTRDFRQVVGYLSAALIKKP